METMGACISRPDIGAWQGLFFPVVPSAGKFTSQPVVTGVFTDAPVVVGKITSEPVVIGIFESGA